jgi:hypothetical protein
MNADRKYSITANVMAKSGRVATATCSHWGSGRSEPISMYCTTESRTKAPQPAR